MNRIPSHFFIRVGIVMSIFLALVARPSRAVEGPSDFFDLIQEVKVAATAAKVSLPLEENPSAVSVITREEIERSHAATLGDLIERIPGVHGALVTDYQRLIGVRGLQGYNSSKTLILLDGVPVNFDWFGTTQWNLLPVPPHGD